MIGIVRIYPHFGRWDELLALIISSFASMDGIIDPPSSAHRLTATSLAEKARAEIGFVAVEDGRLVGCAFLKLEPSFLYVGKLAVAPDCQGKGIGRRLLRVAEDLARTNRLPALRLETRIELAANHQIFSTWGFMRTAENRHAGFDRTTSIEMQKLLS